MAVKIMCGKNKRVGIYVVESARSGIQEASELPKYSEMF